MTIRHDELTVAVHARVGIWSHRVLEEVVAPGAWELKDLPQDRFVPLIRMVLLAPVVQRLRVLTDRDRRLWQPDERSCADRSVVLLVPLQQGNCALWPSASEPPSFYSPATISVLAPFVDAMLSDQHEQSCKQSHLLLFELC
ncbi:MAG: hypothetical protein ACRDRE_26050 [Pseudonocardiaceae bacterium]